MQNRRKRSRKDILFECFKKTGFVRLKGESPQEAAVRLFREKWPYGGELLLEVLACCFDKSMEEISTVAHGTIWTGDEPGISSSPEDYFFKGRERFLQLLLRSEYTGQKTLAA